MEMAVDSIRTCFFVLGGGETIWAGTVYPLLYYCQGNLKRNAAAYHHHPGCQPQACVLRK